MLKFNEDTMSTTPAPGNSSEKRTKPASCTTLLFQLMHMFWVTELALLFVVLYGLYAGWAVRRQWSDAFFYAGAAQIFIAAMTMLNSTGEVTSASTVRYLSKGNIAETSRQLVQVAISKGPFSLRVFIGSLLTLLIAALILWV